MSGRLLFWPLLAAGAYASLLLEGRRPQPRGLVRIASGAMAVLCYGMFGHALLWRLAPDPWSSDHPRLSAFLFLLYAVGGVGAALAARSGRP